MHKNSIVLVLVLFSACSTATNTGERYNTAVSDHRAARYTLAERGYTDVLKQEPRHPGANNNLAIIEWRKQQFSKAEEHLRNALAKRPALPAAQINALVVALKNGKINDMHDDIRGAFGSYAARQNCARVCL